MTLTCELDPPVDEALREEILALWADVSNAGGAVGFVPPVTPEEIRPDMDASLAAVADGRRRLIVGRDQEGRVAATAFVAYNTHRLMAHWVWVYTVMVHPRHQGRGHGRTLMAAVEQAARSFPGIEAIRLTCRGGTGADAFYSACGYKEVGRVPAAIRVAPGDDRDDVVMLRAL
ncbi:GNAT family N-acetyltransferase [Streptomyces cocklensis]|jgi:GNAT superfamily N-acetyltransferase|uniref:Acetyltransferase (GNAT) family protein n=1 Tax=Actinacidiphila cocklensis TaxID=887465 RepID=A0A9W4E0A7_9ACTN|nr:GNAT family N-acetyltransferase [Actinacidiphila cocklensis]MDD1061138.1 GNAT family N-acetyltransferase [Actinacidiphila cocklensis]WSX77456.1 GNAT family N-acetyltransferase [Streptomyces sp. NBC_00899]CAG6398627.1 Acetyltransferase (GNAT) family protein [Actinacidiphila cocklensis]